MIIYFSDKVGFLRDMDSGVIGETISNLMREYSFRRSSPNEVRSWENSFPFMDRTLRGMPEVPDDAGISIEYHIPNSARRIDFIISGRDTNKEEAVVIIELKQWTQIESTDNPSVVRVRYQHGITNTTHPCYQAWSYARLIQDYNETVQNENISLFPCAFLHNYQSDGVIDGPKYAEDIDRAPLFLKNDIERLRSFIKKYIKYGDDGKILERIDNGKIKPSKQLSEHLVSLLQGNPEFVLIDDQKVAYEEVLNLLRSDNDQKNVVIIEGGPGTGKSVLAINLLVEITKQEKVAQYVTKNSAPRMVYQAQLSGTFTKTQISNLFVGSGAFINSEKNTFDTLIIDEAHRLNEKSGFIRNLGENQIKELIHAAKTSVFLIDEDQRVTIHDIGRKDEIRKHATAQGAKVIELELPSQFRCNGSDGYLAWIDEVLQIRPTANLSMRELGYDFKVFDNPNELLDQIKSNNHNNKARMVAGYCWDWVSRNNRDQFDIELDDFNFRMRWNLGTDGMLWIVSPESVNEAGCIHTCQGLELEYVGVIIGPDLVVRGDKVMTDFRARARTDQSLRGIIGRHRNDPESADQLADMVIKNTYRTLMTRGAKGCYVFSIDEETQQYFKRNLG
jgi:uncharacterized protein